MFVFELSGSGFESSCSHLNFRFRACFEQRVPWHFYNYRVDSLWSAYVAWQEHTVSSIISLECCQQWLSMRFNGYVYIFAIWPVIWPVIRYLTQSIRTFNSEFSYNEIWFTDKKSKLLEVEAVIIAGDVLITLNNHPQMHLKLLQKKGSKNSRSNWWYDW